MDGGPGPESEALCCSAPASPERRLSLTSHQLGRHTLDCTCVRVALEGTCGCGFRLVAPEGKTEWVRAKAVIGRRDWAVREQEAAEHGCAAHTRNGGPGGVGQPAHLERGAPHLEEVVPPRADAVPTPPGSVVWDWKMLPGMSRY